jgi:HAE1 family hydrophobic/amphiphilic exporter-1
MGQDLLDDVGVLDEQVSTIYSPTNQYQVILELDPNYQESPETLSLLYVRSNKGQLVPLNSVAKLSPGIGPLTVNHLGQPPSVTISLSRPDPLPAPRTEGGSIRPAGTRGFRSAFESAGLSLLAGLAGQLLTSA